MLPLSQNGSSLKFKMPKYQFWRGGKTKLLCQKQASLIQRKDKERILSQRKDNFLDTWYSEDTFTNFKISQQNIK